MKSSSCKQTFDVSLHRQSNTFCTLNLWDKMICDTASEFKFSFAFMQYIKHIHISFVQVPAISMRWDRVYQMSMTRADWIIRGNTLVLWCKAKSEYRTYIKGLINVSIETDGDGLGDLPPVEGTHSPPRRGKKRRKSCLFILETPCFCDLEPNSLVSPFFLLPPQLARGLPFTCTSLFTFPNEKRLLQTNSFDPTWT